MGLGLVLWVPGSSGLEKGFWHSHSLGRQATHLWFCFLPEVLGGPMRYGTLHPMEQEGLCWLRGRRPLRSLTGFRPQILSMRTRCRGGAGSTRSSSAPKRWVSLCAAATYPIALFLPGLCAFHPSYRHQQFFISD